MSMIELTSQLDALLARQETVLLAIDGPCASGKTTLAKQLASQYDCNILHMDDFFLRPEQRTALRFAEPGGNIDYERFREEVLTPLIAKQPFTYRPFDCSTQAMASPLEVRPKKLTIIEGSYSHHPHFGDIYDLRVFLTVDAALQRQRILQRPAFLHSRFFEAWIPMEQQYFSHFRIRDNSHIIL